MFGKTKVIISSWWLCKFIFLYEKRIDFQNLFRNESYKTNVQSHFYSLHISVCSISISPQRQTDNAEKWGIMGPYGLVISRFKRLRESSLFGKSEGDCRPKWLRGLAGLYRPESSRRRAMERLVSRTNPRGLKGKWLG